VALSAPLVERIAAGAVDPVAAVLEGGHAPSGRLAVRSSAVGEDSGSASFAGQHVTILNVARAGLARAVHAVWASARSDAATAYRERRGLDREPAIGVVVQQLVEPVAAGVLFTRNPVTGARERMIEAAWGLGEAVVGGLVIPDRYRLDASGTVIETEAGHKDMKIWYDGEHGTTELPVPEELHRTLCLRDEHLARLHALAERSVATWGSDLDLEWALGADGVIHLLQARPITTIRSLPA
jgi:pyruvate,water dikinase